MKQEQKIICEMCVDKDENVEHRCTNCDVWICHTCWEELDGNEEYKNCYQCGGVFYK